jgi:hypothetical protein
MSINPDKTFEKAMLQVNGMRTHAFEAKNAPIPVSIIEEEAQSLLSTRTLQQGLKMQLKETTQLLYERTKQLEENMSRNIHYFLGVWGKSDKRLEKVGRRPATFKSRRRVFVPKIENTDIKKPEETTANS